MLKRKVSLRRTGAETPRERWTPPTPTTEGVELVELFFDSGVVFHETHLPAGLPDQIHSFILIEDPSHDQTTFRRAAEWEDPDVEVPILEVVGDFLHRWLPLPYQISAPLAVQVYLAPVDERDRSRASYRALLAIDTRAESGGPPGRHLDAEMDGDRPFRPLRLDELDDFLRLRPVRHLLRRLERDGIERAPLKLAALLGALEPLLPRLQFTPPNRDRPIDVSLVLDLGNSRSTALLVEGSEDRIAAVPLAFRNMSQPVQLSEETFDSRFTFLPSPFDTNAYPLAIDAGFDLPSIVRLGREALDRAVETPPRYQCSLSGPKRYLWDDEPTEEPWYFAGKLGDGYVKVYGRLLKYLPETGDGTHLQEDGPSTPAEPRYAPRAMMLFALVEILSQALSQINAPSYRRYQGKEGRPRRLRHVVLTFPSAMPAMERQVYEELARNATRLVGRFFHIPADQLPNWNPLGHFDDFLFVDEALAAQMVFVYQEVAENFAGSMEAFVDLYGRGKSSIRIASIDIGGGTCDVMIAEYKDRVRGSGTSLVIRRLFQDGVSIAGDEVCRAILEDIVFRQILGQLPEKSERAAFARLFGSGDAGQGAAWRALQAKLVPYLWMPLARCFWAIGEGRELPEHNPQRHYFLADIMELFPGPLWSEALINEADAFLTSVLPSFPGLRNIFFQFDPEEIDEVIQSVLFQPLRNFADVIAQFDADLVVLAGRTSALRVVPRIIAREMPVPPPRIKTMSSYRVGDWYPPRWRGGDIIKDPKSTVTAGAAILHLASRNRLHGFLLDQIGGRMPQPIYGIMHPTEARIRHEDELFREGPKSPPILYTRGLRIGFRNVAAQEMDASPLYEVRPADPDVAQALLEDRVSLVFERTEDTGEPLRIAEVHSHRDLFEFRPEHFVLALKTLDDRRYWTDSGVFKAIEHHL